MLTRLSLRSEADQRAIKPDIKARETQRITRLQADAAQIRQWLVANPEDRKGSKGAIRKSNRTDNESAKMATSKGVIQGYTGVAAVDEIDTSRGYISWISPMARALTKARQGDTVTLHAPGGVEELDILQVKYQEIPMQPFEPVEVAKPAR